MVGIPGCGKSSLAARFVALLKRDESRVSGTLIINYDEYFDSLNKQSSSMVFDAHLWHTSRIEAFESAKKFLSQSSDLECGRLLIVDDNMYYRSMRHQYYRLARQGTLSDQHR